MSDRDVTLECTPMAIGKRLYGTANYLWQDRVLADCMPKWSKTVLRAANESGKTSRIVVCLVMWHLMMFTNGRVVITSGTFRQVEKQVFAALMARQAMFPGFVFNATEILAPDGNTCYGFSTDDPNKAEGWHAEDHNYGPLLLIIDEGKGVPDVIYEAFIVRCRPTRMLVMSSTGPAAGAFYRLNTSESTGWKLHKVTAYDCPHIDRKVIQAQIDQYGIDSPLIRSSIFSEWMMGNDTEQFVFPEQKYELAKEARTFHQAGDREAFCDFAVSPAGDECVFTLREGNRVEIKDAWLGCGNTIVEAARFVRNFRRFGLMAQEIAGDVSGVGQGYCDTISEMGYDIERVNNAAPSSQPEKYANLGTEMWFEACIKAEKGQLIFPWADEKFRRQVTSRKFGVTLKGQLQLISKKKQGGESPDRADGVMGCSRKAGGRFTPHNMFAGNKGGVFPSLNELRNGAGADERGDGPSWMSSTL